MRILFVSEFLPSWNSGAEGSLLSIGNALDGRGHKVTYLWKDTQPGYLPHPRLHDLFEIPARQLERVSAELSKSPQDVVIISQPYSYLVYERLKAAFPRTLFLNRTHGWEDRMSDSWRRLAWRNPGYFQRHLSDLSSTFMSKACERTVKSCHGIITASALCATYIQNHYLPHKTPVSVIPYGVESPLFQQRGDKGSTRLLFVGQYLPRKGSGVLEQILPVTAHQHPGATVTFVVPEHQSSQVETFYRPHFGNRLTILPWMSREKLAAIYAGHDILLFPSFFEGFGKVFLEAMAAGLCVVGFSEGGLPAAAVHPRDALICETGDRHAFRMLLDLALASPALVREIGTRARDTAHRYSWDRHAAATEAFCHSLMFTEVKPAMAS